MCKNISLTLRDTQLKRTAKAISNQTYPVGFNRNPELLNKKTNSNGRAFLEKFWGHGVFHNGWVGVVLPPSIKNWPNLHPSESLPPDFYILPIMGGCYCKPLEISVSICCFCWSLHKAKNQHYSSNQSWHIVDLILRITFGKPRYAWPHSYKWTGSNRCICVCLTTCKKWTLYLGSFKLVALNHFGHVWPHPLEMTEKNC